MISLFPCLVWLEEESSLPAGLSTSNTLVRGPSWLPCCTCTKISHTLSDGSKAAAIAQIVIYLILAIVSLFG